MYVPRRLIVAALLMLAGAGSLAFALGAGAHPATSSSNKPVFRSSLASRHSVAGGALQIAADPTGQVRFTKTKLRAKAGKITIRFTNHARLLHNLAIRTGPKCHDDYRCAELAALLIDRTDLFAGGSKTLTVNLKPGTYVFYCSVPGHQAAGMEGTLTVTR